MMKLWQVFWQFFTLGWISFGGPAAHIGYFERTFVQKLKWIDSESYARLISLSQFLPGPGSSQIGFAIGLRRAGILGGFTAFIAFTFPSFLLLYFLATTNQTQDAQWLVNVTHGLKLLAVVVVADAALNMYKAFCKERNTIIICMITAVVLLVAPSLLMQMLVLISAALIGMNIKKSNEVTSVTAAGITTKGKINYLPLIIFAALFAGLPLLSQSPLWLTIFADFYQSGSLVFGGGHVVLPMLQQALGEAIETDRFLLGYAAAQAVPGPMFSLSAFLGADLLAHSPLTGALIATVAIFLPGFLLVLSFHNAWETLAAKPKVAGAVWGINASVVGLLIAALYQPVFTSAIVTPVDMAVVIVGFFALRTMKVPIIMLVASFIAFGYLMPMITS
ncbi:chorismate-binding protein [Colwellia sp. 75C3]|uniref:chromate efflux transporter n=1 Tax=Colwellia sp. 75C3 TaxID=888425 RepID=UPI000C342167|nr:chromate efflux transporter [Colwellia sp. 75C3]PKG83502.1 chorismate-binding protein [Colwellia sp. 75C3]